MNKKNTRTVNLYFMEMTAAYAALVIAELGYATYKLVKALKNEKIKKEFVKKCKRAAPFRVIRNKKLDLLKNRSVKSKTNRIFKKQRASRRRPRRATV